MMLHQPVHVAQVGGAEVRFFRGPKADPDFPWHAADDLFQALRLNREMRRHFLRSLQSNFGGDIRTIATETGPTTIAPHSAAQGLLGAASSVRRDMLWVEKEYTTAVADAIKLLLGDVPPDAQIDFLLTAACTAGIGGDA